MKYSHRILWLLACLVTGYAMQAQESDRKYQSVFWKITKDGMARPSYLFGTMHVSNKLVFHLDDTFYTALQGVDMVANEINLQTFQRDISEWDQQEYNLNLADMDRIGFESMNEKSMQLPEYIPEIKKGLKREGPEVNAILYRNYEGDKDYEENTYLDMYIYQTARKMGKPSMGLEDYVLQQLLMKQAYNNKLMEKENRHSDMDGHSYRELSEKIEEAYRKGDLDALDSLEQYTIESDAYWELFLFERNRTHANGIDSLIKNGISVFAAVGAAHLPGEKGVIELLKSKGYTLTPIKMKGRETARKEKIDKVRVPVHFGAYTSADSSFGLKVPNGKFYHFNGFNNTRLLQSFDVDNGSFYLVTRITTRASMQGKTEAQVLHEVDSLLYENIPGKIISQKTIVNNGVSGFDIVNKTKTGNTQRYQIFVTPFELLIFKVSGIEEYVVNGPEADTFFNSIHIHNFKSSGMARFTHPRSGVSVMMPPAVKCFFNNLTEDREPQLELEAVDTLRNNTYLVIRKDYFYPTGFETDSFDCALLLESFRSTEGMGKEVFRSFHSYNTLPCLDATFITSDSSRMYHLRSIVKGGSCYLFCVRGAFGTAFSQFNEFFGSVALGPYTYPASIEYTDTVARFRINTPLPLSYNKEARKLDLETELLHEMNYKGTEYNYNNNGTDYNTMFRDEESGEVIFVSVSKYPEYYYRKLKPQFLKGYMNSYFQQYYDVNASYYDKEYNKKNGVRTERDDNKVIIRFDSLAKVYTIAADSTELEGGVWRYHYTVMVNKSSRVFHYVLMNSGLYEYEMYFQTDSIVSQSSFIQDALRSFHPLNNSGTETIYKLKDDRFLDDFRSGDSATLRKARAVIASMRFAKDKLGVIDSIIHGLGMDFDHYFNWKRDWIKSLSRIEMGEKGKEDLVFEKKVAAVFRKIFQEAGDTVMYKNAVLLSLAWRGTTPCVQLLTSLLLEDPPLEEAGYSYDRFEIKDITSNLKPEYDDAASIFPALLELATMPDYKNELYELMASFVERGALNPSAYKNDLSHILFDARIALKRQHMKEEKAMEEERQKDKSQKNNYRSSGKSDRTYHQKFTTDFDDYMTLLYPFYDKNKEVRAFFDKLIQSHDVSLQLASTGFLLGKGRQVPDSLIQQLGANPLYAGWILNVLKEQGREKAMPASSMKQEFMARSLLLEYTGGNSDLPDSIQYVGKTYYTIGNKSGYIYFFRYRENKKDDWQMAISGLQPADTLSVSPNRECVRMTGKKLKKGVDAEDQFQEQVRIMLLSRSRTGSSFYRKSSYDY